MKTYSFLFITIFALLSYPLYDARADEISFDSAKEEAKVISEKCHDNAFEHDPQTNADIRDAEITSNDCLSSEIEKEIKIGFKDNKQQEMLSLLQASRRNISSFYWKIYNENKYCDGYCGTIAYVMNESDVRMTLEAMLAQMIFLNKNKSGY